MFQTLLTFSENREKMYDLILEFQHKNYYSNKSILQVEYNFRHKLTNLEKIITKNKIIVDRLMELMEIEAGELLPLENVDHLRMYVKGTDMLMEEIYTDILEDLEDIKDDLYEINEFEKASKLQKIISTMNRLFDDENLINFIAMMNVMLVMNDVDEDAIELDELDLNLGQEYNEDDF